VDLEADVVDGLHLTHEAPQWAALDGEVLLEVPDLEQGRAILGQRLVPTCRHGGRRRESVAHEVPRWPAVPPPSTWSWCKKQATGGPSSTATRAGTCTSQVPGMKSGQRGWKAQPCGRCSGWGMLPATVGSATRGSECRLGML